MCPVRAFILAGQPASILYGLDVDRVSVLANNINLDLNETALWNVRIEDGGLFVDVKLQSSHPTIKCIAHYKVKTLYSYTITEDWADELCPDFDLSQMLLSIKLVPVAATGQLTVADAQVSAQLETPNGVLDFFAGITTTLSDGITTNHARQAAGVADSAGHR
jgi:hypothetical protein